MGSPLNWMCRKLETPTGTSPTPTMNTTSPVTAEFLAAYSLDEQTYGQYPVATQSNNPANVRMTGLEVNYRQTLTFLPAWARGFSTFVNATISQSEGPNAADFTPFAHKNINWGLSYVRRAFQFRYNVQLIGRKYPPH